MAELERPDCAVGSELCALQTSLEALTLILVNHDSRQLEFLYVMFLLIRVAAGSSPVRKAEHRQTETEYFTWKTGLRML